jgi:succinoglycan biosynthesis transport protein ExoP
MTFSHLLRILLLHLKKILFTIFIVVATTAILTMMTPKRFIADSSIIIDFKGSSPMANSAMPAQLYTNYVATQLDVISSQTVALKVVDDLKIAVDAKARERYLPVLGLKDNLVQSLKNWLPKSFNNDESIDKTSEQSSRYILAEQLLKRLELKPSSESSVVKVGFVGGTPSAAAEGANAFVRAYIATSLELNVNPARQSSDWFDQQVKTLNDNLANAQEKFSAYQQATGIVASEEHLDVENTRLNDISNQLVGAQAENHPGIQALKADLARAEQKLNSLPPQFGNNHPQYKTSVSEVQELRQKLASESSKISSTLQGELYSQKSRVLQMKKQRAVLATLKNDVDNAQRALDQAMQRFNQVKMESQVNQTNIAVVRSAVPPGKADSPKLLLNLALATIAGVVLAFGLALWRELSKRYVRSTYDLKILGNVPVIGVLPAPKKYIQNKKKLQRQDVPQLTFNQ